MLFVPILVGQSPAPFTLEWAKPLPALTQRFQQTEGWTGGDGASSIPLNSKRTLWLFADSWIGKIENGRRVGPRMVNNAAAWQDLGPEPAQLRFFWDNRDKTPGSLLKPSDVETWYWPGEGAVIDGKLYIFCKVIKRKEEGAPGFQFDWFANELVRIDNPNDEPLNWKVSRVRLTGGESGMRLGSGCVVDGDYLYVLALFPANQNKFLENKADMVRIHRDRLAKFDGQGWEYWCEGEKENHWTDRPNKPVVLIRDAAPDQSIGRVRGIDGFVAIYIPLGMGADIVARHAERLEGPWSQPVKLYHCPETDKKVFMYAARHHPELATKDGEIIITYCRNIGDLGEHVRRPEIYFPQGVEVQLKQR
jgi:hypothetical protein